MNFPIFPRRERQGCEECVHITVQKIVHPGACWEGVGHDSKAGSEGPGVTFWTRCHQLCGGRLCWERRPSPGGRAGWAWRGGGGKWCPWKDTLTTGGVLGAASAFMGKTESFTAIQVECGLPHLYRLRNSPQTHRCINWKRERLGRDTWFKMGSL